MGVEDRSQTEVGRQKTEIRRWRQKPEWGEAYSTTKVYPRILFFSLAAFINVISGSYEFLFEIGIAERGGKRRDGSATGDSERRTDRDARAYS